MNGPVDLSSCDREPIHIPGSIQPHGVLFSLGAPEMVVLQVSENTRVHLGVDAGEVVGRPLDAALGRAADRVREALLLQRPEEANPLGIEVGGRNFDGIVHRQAGITLLELEPAAPPSDEPTHPLRVALAGLQAAETVAGLCEALAVEVRRLTGFERVMVYRFHADEHGEVVAECRDEKLDPYLGLHYPASDIPRPARELYLRNWLRIIPDARYQPVPLIPEHRPDNGQPLDLGLAGLRSVSPIHLEYMANMGLRASMSISLVVDDALWGLISCAHHSGPRYLPWETRAACEIVGRLASVQIGALADREAAQLREARGESEAALSQTLHTAEDPFATLIGQKKQLLDLVDASGAVALAGEEILACGRTPPRAFIAALTEWLAGHVGEAPFATSNLSRDFSPAAAHPEVASGLLAIALPGSTRRLLIWLRPEVEQTVSWGGDPSESVAIDPGLRLHPRRSFEAWKETVRFQSEPWNGADLEVAASLRQRALELDLMRQLEREQRAVKTREDFVAVISHDLKNPLGAILMEAARLERRPTPDRVQTASERIQRSAERMRGLIGDLLEMAKLESGRDVLEFGAASPEKLVDEAMVVLRPLAEAKGIAIEERWAKRLPLVRVDRDRIFRVLSNLVGNAIKFTPAGGQITLRGERDGDRVVVTVADSGPGIPQEQLPFVFDRFWQAHRTRSLGTGLGLPIAREIVEAHGGKIWVESKEGQGAAFHFSLQVAGSGPDADAP